MADIQEATQALCGFLKKTLSVEDAKAIKVCHTPQGWEGDIEVYEDSSFIKTIGLPTRVKDRNIYNVKADENLEVQAYERKPANQPRE